MKSFKLNFLYSVSFQGEYSVKTQKDLLIFKNENWGGEITRIENVLKWDDSMLSEKEHIKQLKEHLDLEKEILLSDELISLIENTFDKNGIWEWPKDYNKASGFGEVLDGDLWQLNVKINEKKVKSFGACCYPKSYKKLMKMFSDIFDMDFNKILEN